MVVKMQVIRDIFQNVGVLTYGVQLINLLSSVLQYPLLQLLLLKWLQSWLK